MAQLVCCNNTFRTQDAFWEHKTTHTRGAHLFECNKCSFNCPTMGQMVAHRIIHNRENIAVLEEENRQNNKPWFKPEEKNISEEGSQYVGDNTKNYDEIQQDLHQVENDSTSEDSDSDSNINEEAYQTNSDKDLDSEKDNPNEIDNEENFIATASQQYSKYDYFVNNTLENKDTDWTCFICDTVFQNESLFEEHVRMHTLAANLKSNASARSDIFKFACAHCDFKCKDIEQFDMHKKSHYKNTAHTCKKCQRNFRNKSQLKRHDTKVHRNEHMCELCPFKSNNKTNLARHVESIHKEEDIAYKCKLCTFKTKHQTSLVRHVKRIHNKKNASNSKPQQFDTTESTSNEITKSSYETKAISSFECEVCEYTCTNDIELVEHMKSHKTVYECKLCSRKFKSNEVLKYHILFHNKQNSVANDLSCKICEKSFLLKANLESHMVTHSNEKLFHCTDCNYKSKWKSNLNIHIKKYHKDDMVNGMDSMVVHTNERPFQCICCNYKSNWKSNLKLHMKRHHEDNMVTHSKSKDELLRFVCQFCDYKSKWNNNLNTHIQRMHKNEHHTKLNEQSANNLIQEGMRTEKIYVCNFCEYQTKTESSLKEHVNDNHPIKEKDSRPISEVDNHFINDNAEYDRTERFFYCNFCDYKSKHSANLDRHTIRRHKESYDESCKIKRRLKIVLYKKVEEKKMESVTEISKTRVLKTTKSQQSTFAKLYTCKFCFYKSIYKGSLKKHVLTFHKKGIDDSTQNISNTINKKMKPIVKVKKMDSSEIDLNKDFKPNKRYGCSYCEYTTKWNPKDVRLHMKSKHGKDGIILVKIGNKVIRKIEKKSIIADKKEKTAELRQIKEIDTSKVIVNNETESKKQYKCSYCEYTSKWNSRDVRLHMKNIHGKDGIILVKNGNKVVKKIKKKGIKADKKEESVDSMHYHCSFCDYISKRSSNDVHNHMMNIHGKEGNITIKKVLKKSIKTVKKTISDKKNKKLISTNKNDKSEKKSESIKLKKKLVQTHQKVHSCHMCSYTSYRKAVLDEHLASHNQGSGPVIYYKCPECLQCYIRKASLVTHLETHSGTTFDGPRICPGCNKKIHSNRRNSFNHIEKCLL